MEEKQSRFQLESAKSRRFYALMSMGQNIGHLNIANGGLGRYRYMFLMATSISNILSSSANSKKTEHPLEGQV